MKSGNVSNKLLPPLKGMRSHKGKMNSEQIIPGFGMTQENKIDLHHV